MSKNTDGHLVWMDLEMTGLDPETDAIIEIATIITDQDLNTVAEGPHLILHQEPERFAKMDQWNQDTHTKSGLWQKVLDSDLTLADAEAETVNFLKKHLKQGKNPLCGNSIWQDRRFLGRYMKQVDQYLHYRIVDVSSFKEVIARWAPDMPAYVAKKNSHRALDDIYESIEEMKLYKDHLFKKAADAD